MIPDYPQLRAQLDAKSRELKNAIPEVLQGFRQLNAAAMKEGALPVKHKELIALGIAISARCDGCISYHVRGALAAGASEEEIVECIGVAISMGGGPSVTYGTQAYEALQQFRAQAENSRS
jgi:AhpD family alkylhydroperoxidase